MRKFRITTDHASARIQARSYGQLGHLVQRPSSTGMSLTISVAAPFTTAGAAFAIPGRYYHERADERASASKCSWLSDPQDVRSLLIDNAATVTRILCQSGASTTLADRTPISAILAAQTWSVRSVHFDRSHRDAVQCGDRRPDPAGRAGRPDRVHGRDGRNPRKLLHQRKPRGHLPRSKAELRQGAA